MAYFVAEEFRGWEPRMDDDLKDKLDEFRGALGYPVRVSPAEGAIGRRQGPAGTSQHNVDRWGEVRAIDVMPTPTGPDGAPRAMTKAEAEHAKAVAERVGFTGIGVYPGWQPFPGLHLDTRRDRAPGDPATWAGIPEPGGGQTYVAMDRGLTEWGRYA
jgi:hypothetical protein